MVNEEHLRCRVTLCPVNAAVKSRVCDIKCGFPDVGELVDDVRDGCEVCFCVHEGDEARPGVDQGTQRWPRSKCLRCRGRGVRDCVNTCTLEDGAKFRWWEIVRVNDEERDNYEE